MTTDVRASVQIRGAVGPRDAEVLAPDALAFVLQLHEHFEPRRAELLAARAARQARLDSGELPGFLPETANIRSGDWRIRPVPSGLRDRRVEITGPVDRKMVINALNSGARMFMADFEDANSPTWRNCIDGQINLADAIRGTISYTAPNGTEYRLADSTATLLVRPRGWHLDERHVHVLGQPISASLFDVGLYVYHNAQALLDRGWGPWLYLPKLESHLEARLWNDVFTYMEDTLGLERGVIRATVLIETLPAAFEMDEILYELRDHAAGLNAGRWDYIFSVIKKLRSHARFMLPDRAAVTMTVPFMQAYCNLLVATCHRRGAHAMGGMAAFIPNRRDMEVTTRALAAVTADKQREARAGFDGTWVAHPDLVETAMDAFTEVLDDAPNQLTATRTDVPLDAASEPAHAAALLATSIADAGVTRAGVRANVRVGLLYLAAWLAGSGAVAIDNLMEDAATAEISRSQLWQWIRHGATMDDGSQVTAQLVQELLDAEVAAQCAAADTDPVRAGLMTDAAGIFAQIVLDADFTEFITFPAYDVLMQREAKDVGVQPAQATAAADGGAR
jgi:malate synthase